MSTAAAAAETKECAMCGFLRDKSGFSAYSWKKPAHQRKCSTCTKKPTHRKCNLCHMSKEAGKYAPYELRDPPGRVTCSDCLRAEGDKADAAKAAAEENGFLCPIYSYLKVLEPKAAEKAQADVPDLVTLSPTRPSVEDVVGEYEVIFYVSPLDLRYGSTKYFSRKTKGLLTFTKHEKKMDGAGVPLLLHGLLQMDPSTHSYVVPREDSSRKTGQLVFHSSSTEDVAFYHDNGLGERMFEEGQVHSSVSMEKEDVPMKVKDNSLPLKIRHQYPEDRPGYQPKVSAYIQTVAKRVALPACKDDLYEWELFKDLPAPITVEEGEAESDSVFFLEPGDLWLRFTDYSEYGLDHPALLVARKKERSEEKVTKEQSKKRKLDE